MRAKNLRIVFVGPAGVGKTSLVRVINGQRLSSETESTVGLCALTLTTESGVTVEVWDTAGQERYAPMMDLYTRDADIIIAAHDHINDVNQRQMRSILERLEAVSNSKPKTFALWQTKKDLCAVPNPHVVSAFVRHHTAFVSALEEPEEVRMFFNELVQLHLQRHPPKQLPPEVIYRHSLNADYTVKEKLSSCGYC